MVENLINKSILVPKDSIIKIDQIGFSGNNMTLSMSDKKLINLEFSKISVVSDEYVYKLISIKLDGIEIPINSVFNEGRHIKLNKETIYKLLRELYPNYIVTDFNDIT